VSTQIQHLRAIADDPRANPNERANARRAIDQHNAKILERDDTEAEPPGPDLTRRGGPFPAKVDGDGLIWVAVRGAVVRGVSVGPMATAESWVADRRRMLVRLGGQRFAMIPTRVEVDDDRQQIHVTADRDSLTVW